MLSLALSVLATTWPAVVAHAVATAEFAWAIVAEVSILVFTILLAPRWAGRPDLPRFRLLAFGAALLASLVTLIGKLLEVCPGHPLFPSGHTAYALTIAVFLIVFDRRWLRVVGPMLAPGRGAGPGQLPRADRHRRQGGCRAGGVRRRVAEPARMARTPAPDVAQKLISATEGL